VEVFHRAAGDPSAPVVLLLHGYPSSSHQFRTLIPLLAPRYRVLAPDLPGFGFTTAPNDFEYTFANFASVIGEWLDALEVKKFALYVFDYGAPTGLRLALSRPDAIAGIVTQNGNAYIEGLGPFFDPLRAWWASGDPKDANTRLALDNLLSTLEHTKAQYTDGVPAHLLSRIDPAAYTLDFGLFRTPQDRQRQIDIFWDYRTNVALYPAFQAYFRARRPPTLAVWGKNDSIFVAPGAEAFKRDNPRATVAFVESGHFALETHVEEIAGMMLPFLEEAEW
jgi:pimeloyl-ACP methyl ester carboxylesterase